MHTFSREMAALANAQSIVAFVKAGRGCGFDAHGGLL